MRKLLMRLSFPCGTIADAHTGKRLAIDLSALAALLRESLAHAPGQVGDAQDEGEMSEP